ncbi:MAG: glycolate oxidase subunit GlcE [Burkholderiaceae bacterium]
MASLVQGPAATTKPGAPIDGLYGLIETVRSAAGDKTALAIRGSNTKSWYGHRGEGSPIDVRVHTGIVDYEPSELVLVARAGTPLREIEALLAQHRQMLAFEPPLFAPAGPVMPRTGNDAISMAMIAATRGATLGGCVASGLSGPRRMAAGSVRDFVLGARLIDGRGQHLAFGGQVMKNVAGYDVSRALVGSLGMLGIVTEVSLKVLPIPMQSVTLSFTIDEQAALDQLNQWAGQPIAITASSWASAGSRSEAQGGNYASRGGRMLVRLEGSEPAVQSGIRRLGGLDVDPSEADAAWVDLREQTHPFFGRRPADGALWRIALPPTTPALDAVVLGFDDQLIEWGGALRWIATRVDPRIVRDTAARLGGHATLWRAPNDMKTTHGVFAPLSAPLMAIHRRLKAEFDPDRLFNRGRMYPEL